MAVHNTTKKMTVREYKAEAWQNSHKSATVIFNGKKYYNNASNLTDRLLVDYVEVSHGDIYIYAVKA